MENKDFENFPRIIGYANITHNGKVVSVDLYENNSLIKCDGTKVRLPEEKFAEFLQRFEKNNEEIALTAYEVNKKRGVTDVPESSARPDAREVGKSGQKTTLKETEEETDIPSNLPNKPSALSEPTSIPRQPLKAENGVNSEVLGVSNETLTPQSEVQTQNKTGNSKKTASKSKASSSEKRKEKESGSIIPVIALIVLLILFFLGTQLLTAIRNNNRTPDQAYDTTIVTQEV